MKGRELFACGLFRFLNASLTQSNLLVLVVASQATVENAILVRASCCDP